MANKTGLGKGLDALFGDTLINDNDKNNNDKNERVEILKIIDIEPNKDQPRKNFDEDGLRELSESIKQYGVIQPIIVTKKDKYYEIVAGERRWRAAKMAGLSEMPCLIRTENEQTNREISLIENIQRKNLNPIEKAMGYRRLIDDYNLTQQSLADKIGMNRSTVTNTLRLLNLDDRVLKLLRENEMPERYCRALLQITDSDKQYQLALSFIESEESSTDNVDRIVKNQKLLSKKDEKKAKKYEAIYKDIEDSFQGFFGTKVKLEAGKRRGKIVIEYSSNDDLERILNLIK